MNIFHRWLSGVLKSPLSPVASGRGWWPLFIREPYTGAWQRNDELRGMDLLGSPIVYACITLIANDVAKLRPKLVQRRADGIWLEVEGAHPALRVLRAPNRYQNHIQFKQWWVMSRLRTGNTYVLKERDQKGEVVRLYILDPARVQPLVSDDGSVFYQLGQDNLSGQAVSSVTVPASEIIHDRMNCLYHPLVGISPLYAAAIAAGIGVKIQDNTLRFFGNSARPGGILVAPGNISPENAAKIKEAWDTNYSGGNSGKVAVLGDGMKFEPMSSTAVDSQLIETLRWSDERICSVFHVPAFKVGVGAAPTYNNIEALDRAYYSGCVQSHIEEMEASLDGGLGLDGINIGVELDLDGLMRMDSKTQMEALKTGVDGGIFAVNDARAKVNLPPLAGGDTVYMQQQDFPLDQVRLNTIGASRQSDSGATQAAESGSIQQEALNGAQVTALQGIIFAVAAGTLPAEAATALISAAFPLLTDDQISEMLSGAQSAPQADEPDDEERGVLLQHYLTKELGLEHARY